MVRVRCPVAALVALCLLAAPAAAGQLTYAELRIWTPFWDVAIFPGIVDAAEAASDTSIVVDARSFEIVRTPPPVGHHMHFYGNDAATLTGATPGQLGGDLRFFGDWEIGGQTVWYQPWTIGVPHVAPSGSTGDSWTVGTVTVQGGTWFTRFPTATGQTVGTVMTGLLSAMGTNALTESGYGMVTLVTPMTFVSLFVPSIQVGAIGELRLIFAPEPGVGSAFAAGAALLLALGRRRDRRRS